MNELFDYSIIAKIKNEDYLLNSRGLLERCKRIEESYRNGYFDECCRLVRQENEGILRYIYERLAGQNYNTKNTPMAGEILRDNSIVQRFEPVFYRSSKRIQEIGNQYSHSKNLEYETEEQYASRHEREKELSRLDAEEIIKLFSDVLSKGIEFINNELSGVRGKVSISHCKRINAQTGRPESLLVGVLSDVTNQNDYRFTWKVKGHERPLQIERSELLLDQEWLLGETIILEVSRIGMENTLTARYRPLRREEITTQEDAEKELKKRELSLIEEELDQLQETVRRFQRDKDRRLSPVVGAFLNSAADEKEKNRIKGEYEEAIKLFKEFCSAVEYAEKTKEKEALNAAKEAYSALIPHYLEAGEGAFIVSVKDKADAMKVISEDGNPARIGAAVERIALAEKVITCFMGPKWVKWW